MPPSNHTCATTNTLRPRVLFIGAGSLALGCLPYLQAYQCYTIARSLKTWPPDVTFWQGDIASPAIQQRIRQQAWSAIVITLTPENASLQAYNSAYWLNVQSIVQALAPQNKPFVLFASSTRVYGYNQGEWVDEDTPAMPADAQGECLLRTEAWLAHSGVPSCSVRFSGIYGPHRDYLVRQVLAGQGGDHQFTNRIHQADACGVLLFLLKRALKGQPVPNCLLASDTQPYTSTDIRHSIAGFLGLPQQHLQPSTSGRGGNKRCSVKRLQHLGFNWQYPDSKAGYAEIIKAYLQGKTDAPD